MAVDYVCGSITSTGEVAGEPPEADLEPRVRAFNPYVKQFENRVRGYGALDLTDERLVTEYRSGPVNRPDAEVKVIERFTQQAGEAVFTRESNPQQGAAQARVAARAPARLGRSSGRAASARAPRGGGGRGWRRRSAESRRACSRVELHLVRGAGGCRPARGLGRSRCRPSESGS